MATMYPRILKIESIPPTQSFFLFGPRTTGKSTLIHDYLKDKLSLTYDLLRNDDYLRLHSNPSLIRQDVEVLLKKNSQL